MPKDLLKAWAICSAIWPLSIALAQLAYTPLALTGVLISIPGMLGELLVTRVPLSDSVRGIAMITAGVVFGSLFYGTLAFIVIRLRHRRRSPG
jgi:hypothetical protein